MWTLPSKYRMHFGYLSLDIERFEVVRHSNKILLRCQLVVRIAPIAVAKNPQSTLFDKFDDPVLNQFELTGTANVGFDTCYMCPFFRFFCRGFGICLRGCDHIDKIKRMQMIKVHKMVMEIERALDQISYNTCIFGYVDAKGIFNCLDTSLVVCTGTHTAYTHRHQTTISRITTLKDDFDTSKHG